MLARLTDGTRVVIRAIRPEDKELLAEGIRHLSRESAYKRFLAPKPRLTSRELRYLTEVDGDDHTAFVALPTDGPPVLLGVGRWVRLPEDRRTAEVAVVVGDPFQGKGLGSRLGIALADAAAAHGVRRFTATILADNVPALKLLERVSLRLDETAGDDPRVREVVAELAA